MSVFEYIRSLDFCVVYLSVCVLSLVAGAIISSFYWERKFNRDWDNLIESLPEGKTLFLGELSDEECNEVLNFITEYATKKNKMVSFLRREDSNKNEGKNT